MKSWERGEALLDAVPEMIEVIRLARTDLIENLEELGYDEDEIKGHSVIMRIDAVLKKIDGA